MRVESNWRLSKPAETKKCLLFSQDRVDRRGRPIASNNDVEIRNLQQEIMDKNKVSWKGLDGKCGRQLKYGFESTGNIGAATFSQ